jgi:hypothetical protein
MHEIDIPTPEGIVYLGDAVDQFVLWHKNDIQLGSTDGTDRPPRIPVSPPRPPREQEPRDPPVSSPPQSDHVVASPPRSEPAVASPPIEKEIEVQSRLEKNQSEVQVQEVPPAQQSERAQSGPERTMPDELDPSQTQPSQPEEPKGADVPVMVRTHKHKGKSESKKRYMITGFRGRDKDIKDADFDDRKLTGLKETLEDYLNYINCPDVPHEFQNGQPFIHAWQLTEGPWQLRRWHEWYIRASTIKGLSSFTVAVQENIF